MAEELTGTVVAEKYRVDSLLRSGDLGNFYRGRHIFMDKPVILKVLPPALAVDQHIRDQFTAEARSSSALSNPHILAATDFASGTDNSYYVVYDGFEAEPLMASIGSGGRFSVERAVDIAKQAAQALAAANEAGFIHGHLTPESILVANTPDTANVKVFDFEPAANSEPRTADEKPAANVAYLAPEQFLGLRNIDGRTDIYSLGIILYQMLTGEVPFKGETPTDVILKHAEEAPPLLRSLRPDAPQSLDAVVQKALAKDPDERYQTAAEFAADLENISNKTSPASTNTIWKTAAIVLIGIAALAAALIYLTSVKQNAPLTQLQADANGQPVQPINPATGADEQALAAMPLAGAGELGNTNMAQPPGTLPGGDNYNPWATGVPPPGAPLPNYVPPGGQVYQIDPNSGSPFMPPDTGVILVPVPANANTGAKPTPTPKNAGNANTQTAPPANASAKPSPTPAAVGTPAKAPAGQPKPTPRRSPVGKPAGGEPSDPSE